MPNRAPVPLNTVTAAATAATFVNLHPRSNKAESVIVCARWCVCACYGWLLTCLEALEHIRSNTHVCVCHNWATATSHLTGPLVLIISSMASSSTPLMGRLCPHIYTFMGGCVRECVCVYINGTAVQIGFTSFPGPNQYRNGQGFPLFL